MNYFDSSSENESNRSKKARRAERIREVLKNTEEEELKKFLKPEELNSEKRDIEMLRMAWKKEKNRESARKSREKRTIRIIQLEEINKTYMMKLNLLGRTFFYYDRTIEAMLIFIRTMILRLADDKFRQSLKTDTSDEALLRETRNMQDSLEYILYLRRECELNCGIPASGAHYRENEIVNFLIEEIIILLKQFSHSAFQKG